MSNEIVKAAILDVVEHQLRDNNPPETKAADERLIGIGYSDEDARILIGQVVTHEIFDITKSGKEFNLDRFVARLAQLPKEPSAD